MRIAFDIGGVLSKYPDEFKTMMGEFVTEYSTTDIYIITDQHPKDKVVKILNDNGFRVYSGNRYFDEGTLILEENIYCADYEKYGDMCKPVLCRNLKIDILIDDHMGYLGWDSSWGKAPLRLLVMPDARRPYWHEDWKQDGGDFGRRVYND